MSELNKGPRPDYESLKELAKELDRPVSTLIALSAQSDPFYAGVAGRRLRAEWFVTIWEKYKFREGIHQRGVHYIMVSQKPLPTDHEGMHALQKYQSLLGRLDIGLQRRSFAGIGAP